MRVTDKLAILQSLISDPTIANPEVTTVLEWSYQILSNHYINKKNKYLRRKDRPTISKVQNIEDYTCIIRTNGKCSRMYISKDESFTVLVCKDIVIATCNNGKYFISYGQYVTQMMRNHITKFLQGKSPTKEFLLNKFQGALDKIDISKPKFVDYSRTKDKSLYWRI